MKNTLLIAAFATVSLGGSAYSQQEDARPQRQGQAHSREEMLRKFQQLTPEQKARIRERLQHLKQLPPERRQQIRERVERIQERRGEMTPERVQQLREQLRGRLHRPGPDSAPERNMRPGNPERRGMFVPPPDALRGAGDRVREFAGDKQKQIVERLLNSGKINREQAAKALSMPPERFFEMARRLAGHPQSPEGTRPAEGRQPQPGQRPPQRGNGGERRKGDKPQQNQGGGERRGGV